MSDGAHIEPASSRRGPLIPPIRVTPEERWRLVLVIFAALLLIWLISGSFDALGPFILALVLAYLMMPLVDRLDRFLPRGVAILVVYLVFLIVVIAIGAWLFPIIGNQTDQLFKQLPTYSKQLQEWTASLTKWYNSLPLSDDIRNSLENSVRNGLGSLASAAQQGVIRALELVSHTMGFVLGLLIIPFWLFYVLKDKDRGFEALNNMLPRSWRGDFWRILRIINGVLSSYIRGQLLLGFVVGAATTIGMIIVGAPFPIILGVISGITEVIPVIGPILGAIPGIVLAAFSGDWVLVLKVLLVYVLVQQLENNLLVPKIQGDSVQLHPAIIMVALVIGSQVAGFMGLIVAVPFTAVLRDIYLYLYRRFAEDFTPRQAEASVPSRHDEQTEHGRAHEAKELAIDRQTPGINSEDELIANLDSQGAAREKIPAATIEHDGSAGTNNN